MLINWMVYASGAAALSSALVAGVFQAFSDFVMKGLIAAEPAGGIQSMQKINQTVYRSVFLMLLLGLAPVTLGLAACAYYYLSGISQTLIVSGAAFYVLGVFLVTLLGNVPMNKHLDGMSHTGLETVRYWRTYGRVWTKLNHLRTFGSVATAICFFLAAIALK